MLPFILPLTGAAAFFLTVAGRSARRGDGQGGAGARRRALPARVWRTAARCGLSVWRHHHRESVVGRPEGAQPPNTAGGNTTRGETAHGGTPPANIFLSATTRPTEEPTRVKGEPELVTNLFIAYYPSTCLVIHNYGVA